jgi:hypothetical protein
MFQTEFEGLTGHIAFNDKGYRKNYGLRLFGFGFRSHLKEVGLVSKLYTNSQTETILHILSRRSRKTT